MNRVVAFALLNGLAVAQKTSGTTASSSTDAWFFLIPFLPFFLVPLVFYLRSAGFFNRHSGLEAPALMATPVIHPRGSVGMPKLLEFKETRMFDVGQVLGVPALNEVELIRIPQGVKLSGLPPFVTARADNFVVLEESLVRFEQELEFWQGDQFLGSLSPVSRLPRATPERWGKGKLSVEGHHTVSFNLGGLAPVDLGQRLDVPSLGGFVLVLARGGMRILSLPEGVEVRTQQQPLQQGDKIGFGDTTELQTRGRSIAQFSLVGLEGAPSPKAQLDYIGARPMQFRQSVALFEALDFGQNVPDEHLERLCFGPGESGVKILHIPGGLVLSSAGYQQLEPGANVRYGQSIYIRDLSTRAGLGIIDVSEP